MLDEFQLSSFCCCDPCFRSNNISLRFQLGGSPFQQINISRLRNACHVCIGWSNRSTIIRFIVFNALIKNISWSVGTSIRRIGDKFTPILSIICLPTLANRGNVNIIPNTDKREDMFGKNVDYSTPMLLETQSQRQPQHHQSSNCRRLMVGPSFWILLLLFELTS